jgi:tyrosinase
METTRRMVIVEGCVIGAGIIASGLSGLTALAGTKPPPLRRSLEGLAWNDPIVETYRDGVGIMKQMASSEKFNWVRLSEIHGSMSEGYRYCPHGDWYFLPWHRAFTAMYERIIRHLVKNDEFAMPFWDWTANPLMPEVFLSKDTPAGKPNWLYVDEDGQKRTWPADRPMPNSIVGPDVLAKILKATPFEIFGTSRPEGQDSLDPSWVVGGGGVQGILEGRPHNQVHNNIGGWMPSPASPRDPIFFMHHCNIDRIWAVWNLHHENSKDPLWTDMPFADNFWNDDGTPWSPKVSDLYSPEALGYSYGLSAFVATAAIAGPKTLALNQKLTMIISGAGPRGAIEGVTTASVENSKAATATQPLSLAVQIPEGVLDAIAHRAPVPSGVEGMNFSAALEVSASGARALAFLREVEITDPRTTSVRVFMDAENLSANTPDTDRHYVGSFAVLDHGGGGHGRRGHYAAPSFVLDLTEAIQRLYGGGERQTGAIRLQLLPVAVDEGKPGAVTPKRVEIAIVTT